MIKKTNKSDDDWTEMSVGSNFQHSRLALTNGKDASGLGCAVFSVSPGKKAFPRHAHLANDEAIYVLSGSGSLNVGDQELALREGDYVSLPRGSEFAHVLLNDGQDDLVYLCMSTMNMPDVVHYPDSDKLGVLEQKNWGGSDGTPGIGGFYQRHPVGYWDGEDTGGE